MMLSEAHPNDSIPIPPASQFARDLRALFAEIRPRKLLETGTYLGDGSTRIIASCLAELALDDARFLSIEVNPEHHRVAAGNLARRGLLRRVTLVNGLSLPRRVLPGREEIHQTCAALEGRVHLDFPLADCAAWYVQETGFPDVPDDLLARCLAGFDGSPDFVLLDSAGHVGYLEYRQFLACVRSPCYLALDDVDHVKHTRSFAELERDPRFTIRSRSHEKYGYCIAHFTP